MILSLRVWYVGFHHAHSHGGKLSLQCPRAGVNPIIAHEEHVHILVLKLYKRFQRSPLIRIQDPRLRVAESVAADPSSVRKSFLLPAIPS